MRRFSAAKEEEEGERRKEEEKEEEEELYKEKIENLAQKMLYEEAARGGEVDDHGSGIFDSWISLIPCLHTRI